MAITRDFFLLVALDGNILILKIHLFLIKFLLVDVGTRVHDLFWINASNSNCVEYFHFGSERACLIVVGSCKDRLRIDETKDFGIKIHP